MTEGLLEELVSDAKPVDLRLASLAVDESGFDCEREGLGRVSTTFVPLPVAADCSSSLHGSCNLKHHQMIQSQSKSKGLFVPGFRLQTERLAER